MNNVGPYGIHSLRSGILPGHSATLGSSNLIVENITMNDARNGSDYTCVVIPNRYMVTVANIMKESNPIILNVMGEY